MVTLSEVEGLSLAVAQRRGDYNNNRFLNIYISGKGTIFICG